MNLQNLSVLTFAALLAVFLLFVSIFFSTILLASYSDLEKKYVEHDLEQAVNKINDELFSMSSIASDWGPWDDTVDFVNGNDPNYLSSNLQPYGFDNLNLNIMAFTNNQGKIIFSGSYDLQNKVMVPVPAFFSNRIALGNPLMNMSDPRHITKGILMLPENPLLVVSQPIVYSNYTGQIQGVVIMGRYLNSEEIARLATLTQPSLSLTPISDPSLSSGLDSPLWEMNSPVPEIIQTLNQDQIAGYALIRDIYGDDALLLRIVETRDIYHQGMNTTIQVILIILVGGLVMGLGGIVLLNRKVLERIGSLADQVQIIGRSGNTTDRVEMQGDDELSGLGSEINRMLETIEQAQQKIRESEAEFRDLVENLPDYILVSSLNGDILYLNPAAARALGYAQETVIGTPASAYIAEEYREQMSAHITVAGKSEAIPDLELDLLNLDGIRRSVIVKGREIRYNNNPAIFLLLYDITQRKELEKEREDHSQELEQYSQALHQANIKLRLLTGLTRHDIQNKLTSIRSFLLLANDEPDNGDIREYISHADLAARKIEAIISFTREYENFGIISSGWQPVRLIIESAMAEIPLGSIIVENQIPDNLGIYADPIIRKVFSTLMENSVRHGEKITGILFSCLEDDNGLDIIYSDDGVGIGRDEKEYIFHHGYGKHTGLGLFLAREILSITGLSIRECGVPGQGVRFEIRVPPGKYKRNIQE